MAIVIEISPNSGVEESVSNFRFFRKTSTDARFPRLPIGCRPIC